MLAGAVKMQKILEAPPLAAYRGKMLYPVQAGNLREQEADIRAMRRHAVPSGWGLQDGARKRSNGRR
jgi:hypothetical protein